MEMSFGMHNCRFHGDRSANFVCELTLISNENVVNIKGDPPT